MASKFYVDLKLNRSLINPNFSGYKLSLDALPNYRTALGAGLDVVKLPDSLYSYQHLKAFGIHNHIYLDPWHVDAVFFVDEQWRIMKAVMQGFSFKAPAEQFKIPDAANRRLIPDRLNVSLHFVSSSLVAVSDGAGKLFLLITGDRHEDSEWKIGYSGYPLNDESRRFVILHAVLHTSDNGCFAEVLCIHVDSNPLAAADDSAPSFITKLEWLTFYSDNAATFDLVRVRSLEGLNCPDYSAILPDGKAIIIMSEKQFKFTHDSVRPVDDLVKKASVDGNDDEEKTEPVYTWSQTKEDVTVFFKLPPEINKTAVNYDLRSDRFALSLEGRDTLLIGNLFDLVDVDASTWIINDEHILEVHLTKAEPGTWNTLVIGDNRGKMVLTAEQMAEINEQLDKFTTDNENADPQEGRKPAFNTQQLEECDMFPEDSSFICCLDGETHSQTQQVNISGNQWLFNAQASAESLPVVCLRHDVDGIIWQPALSTSSSSTDSSLLWQHIGTFDAFGYVQASKQQRKFTTCDPSMSYVAVADCVRHIYVYRRPTSIASPLRNRRTGETVSAVARQQLISLDSTEDIMGMRANGTDLFVVAGKTLYAIRINSLTE